MKDVVCIGEMLIDFICSDIGVKLEEGVTFSKKAGGAPANVAAGISRLGGSSAFVGKAGDDPFGRFLKKTLEDESVDVSNFVLDGIAKTSLAFVSIEKNGQRDFTFFREPGADTLLKASEVDMDLIRQSKIFHFGSISLIGGDIKETTLAALKEAKQAGVFVSYDPNLRESLWPDLDTAVKTIKSVYQDSDLIKISSDEMNLVTGQDQEDDAISYLHDQGISLVMLTLGKDGAIISNGRDKVRIHEYPVKVLDTTGAGDGFTSGALYQLSRLGSIKEEISDEQVIRQVCEFANKVGAMVTTKYGAISSLPSLNDVENFSNGV